MAPVPRSLHFIVPGQLNTRTGGFIYDRRIIAGLRASGWTVDVHELEPGFPAPSPPIRMRAGRTLAAIPDGALVVVDGLALGALPDEAARQAGRLQLIALVHHPLALETGLDAAARAELEESERRALMHVRHVIVTSRATARTMIDYGVDPFAISVVEPGTDRAPLAPGSQSPNVEMLMVATVIPRKGHSLLCRALASLPQRNWRLTCVGSLERDRATATRLRSQLAADKISDRVRLIGDVDGEILSACYERTDVFVMPTFYEGYGMAVAEALARGLPVVATSSGAIPELVREDAGLLVPPGNMPALADALSRIIGDAQLRERLAEGARRTRAGLPAWEDAARQFADALGHAASHGRVYR